MYIFGLIDPVGVDEFSIWCLQVDGLIIHAVIVRSSVECVGVLRLVIGEEMFALDILRHHTCNCDVEMCNGEERASAWFTYRTGLCPCGRRSGCSRVVASNDDRRASSYLMLGVRSLGRVLHNVERTCRRSRHRSVPWNVALAMVSCFAYRHCSSLTCYERSRVDCAISLSLDIEIQWQWWSSPLSWVPIESTRFEVEYFPWLFQSCDGHERETDLKEKKKRHVWNEQCRPFFFCLLCR